MAICDELLKEKLSSGCRQPGGIGSIFYIGHTENVLSYAFDTTSEDMKTLTLITGKRLWKFQGEVRVNTAGAESGEGDNGVWNQSVTIVFTYANNKELKAIIDLCKAQKLFVVFPSNDQKYKVAGLNVDSGQNAIYEGLAKTTGSQVMGTVSTDARTITVTLGGPISNPILDYLSTSLAATRTELEALLTPAA